MQIEERTAGDIVILTLQGDLTLGKGADVALTNAVRKLLDQGQRKLVIDLAEVPYVDSAGLGVLARACLEIRNAGGALKLMRITRRMKDLLTITTLSTLLESHETEAEAVASFPPSD